MSRVNISKPLPSGASIAIIGAGVIGVASAFELSQKGYQVVVYDDHAVGEGGPSKANAGHIAGSDIYPLSTPGIHWKALKMLLNADAPLKIPLADALKQASWFWRFWRTSQGQRFIEATKALSYLSTRAIDDTRTMFESANLSSLLMHKSCAYLYDSTASFEASLKSWSDKAERGFSSTEMDSEKIAIDIAGLAEHFKHGVMSHHWAIVSDPLEVVRDLAQVAIKKGVEFKGTRVNSLSDSIDSVCLHTNQGDYKHDLAIVASGVHSPAFAKQAGDFLPIVAERGYNLTLPTPGFELELPLVFADRGVVATHLSGGLRIGGWAEYAAPHRPANQHYFKSMAGISAELFPNANFDRARFWMGNRPSTPDSVPVISKSAIADRIFYNCGHGHYGLTYAASSARILCDLIAGDSMTGNSIIGDGVDDAYARYSIHRFL
ncbi:MAG: D-amino-acid dehydrogenase [Gammaproteobacteria bacterium]